MPMGTRSSRSRSSLSASQRLADEARGFQGEQPVEANFVNMPSENNPGENVGTFGKPSASFKSRNRELGKSWRCTKSPSKTGT